jgi:hypothetical protein
LREKHAKAYAKTKAAADAAAALATFNTATAAFATATTVYNERVAAETEAARHTADELALKNAAFAA